MTDGIHLGLAPAEYFAEPGAISKSVLMGHRLSAAHAYHAMTVQTEQTPAMRLGSLVHTLVLEPHRINERYVVGPDAARNTKEWKTWSEEHSDGREQLKGSEYAEAAAMAGFMRTMPTIARLIQGPGPVEASMFWTAPDKITGVPLRFRGRPDKIHTDLSILIDLKTTADISDRGIERTIQSFGYHLQAALYMRGLAALGTPCDHAVIVWIENKAPHTARATLLGQSWIDAAEAELNALIIRHAECVSHGEWPGFADVITDSEAPAWIMTNTGGAL